MRSTWQKIVYMWNTHKRRFVGAIFCLVLVLGVGSQVIPALAADPVPPAGPDLYDMALTLMAQVFDAVFEMAFKVVSLLISVLISIVSYDTFSDNAAIKVGWPIVRNAINMFVILGLLFIAIKNLIPGQGDNANTQGQLFKVLVAVVLMNFSQTIALLAVDLSQVVTITFAQAISDIGAGNFIQLFGLQNYLTLAPDANSSVSGSGSQAAILLGTALFKLVMLGAVALAILVMIVAFVVRIVLLWFLIIVSPAAFFAFGLGGALPMAGDVWKQWSDQFMGLLVFGPVLTFFLWLSLAIAAGGDMAATLDFEVDPSIPSAGLLASAQPASILSTVLAVIMIFIGIAVSAQVASASMGVGAIVSKGSDLTRNFITRGAKMAAYGTALGATGGLGAGIAAAGVGAMGLGAGAAGVAATLAGGASGYGATYLRTEGAVNKYQGALRSIDRGLSRVQGVGTGPNASILGRVTGAALGVTGIKAGAAGLRQATSAGSKALGGIGDARMAEAEARMKERDSASLQNDLDLAQGTLTSNFSTPEQIADARAVMKKFLTDKDFVAGYKTKHGEPAFNARAQEAFSVVGDDFFDYLDDKDKKAAKEALFKFKAGNIHLLNDSEAKKVLNDGDFKKSMLSTDALFIKEPVLGANGQPLMNTDGSPQTRNVTRDAVWQALADTQEVVGYDNDGNPKRVSMARQLRDGRDGTKKIQSTLEGATQATGGASEYIRGLEEIARPGSTTPPVVAAPTPPPVAVNGNLNPAVPNPTPDQVREAVATRQLEMQNINDQVLNQYQDAVVGAVIGSAAALNLDALSDTSRNRINTEITRQQAALENRIQNEQGGIAAPDQATELTNLRRARFGLSRQGSNLRASGSEAVYVQPGNTGAFQSPELRTEFTNELRRDFTTVRHVAAQAVQGDLAQEMQQIFDARQAAIQQEAIRAMRAQDQAAIANIRESLGKYRAAIANSPALSADPAGQRTRMGTIRRLEGVLSASPSGPPPPPPAPAPTPAPGPRPGRGRRRGPRGGGGTGGGGTP